MTDPNPSPSTPIPIILQGRLGWGNRKSGLEAYGPGGRWGGEGQNSAYGDLLGDALEREGVGEGAALVIIALPRGWLPDPDTACRQLIEEIRTGTAQIFPTE